MPEALIGPCVRAQGLLRGGRPVDVDDLHLTLSFVEDARETGLEDLDAELGTLSLPRCEIGIAGVAGFGFPPNAVGLEVAMSRELELLHQKVARAVRMAGLQADAKRFRPHITLARGKPDAARLLEAPVVHPPVPVTALNLWSSVLTPQGPRYEVLATYPLGGL